MALPLILSITDRAKNQVRDLLTWLFTQSEDAAERFDRLFSAFLTDLCQRVADEIATGGRPAFLPNEEASLAYSRPAYAVTFTTQKKRIRRSASGTYKIIYVLLDADNDGTVDTLSILSIRHAASRPLWELSDG